MVRMPKAPSLVGMNSACPGEIRVKMFFVGVLSLSNSAEEKPKSSTFHSCIAPNTSFCRGENDSIASSNGIVSIFRRSFIIAPCTHT